MSASVRTERIGRVADAHPADSGWNSLYKVGGVTALLAVLVSLLDILVTLLPGEADTEPGTLAVTGWFTLFQDNWFLGLRNLGLFNVINMAFAVPLYLALYAALRRANRAYAALAAVLYFMGAAIYITNNKALPMLALSSQYAAATTEPQRSLLAATGQALLAQGEDFTPGSFLGFSFPLVASIIMNIVMLRSRIFSKLTAWAGILGSGFLFIFTIWTTFAQAMFAVAMIVAMVGGLLSMAWNILVARRLFQLGQGAANLSG